MLPCATAKLQGVITLNCLVNMKLQLFEGALTSVCLCMYVHLKNMFLDFFYPHNNKNMAKFGFAVHKNVFRSEVDGPVLGASFCP